jgi:LysM repeat protein
MDNNPIWLNDELGDVANGGGDKGKQPTYTVHSGDNLTKIAKKYNTTVEQIVKWNNIPDPNKIKVGQVIKVGPKPTQNSKPKPKTNTQAQKTQEKSNVGKGGQFAEISIGGAVGGGISLSLGVVSDSKGNTTTYFTFSGNSGIGGGFGFNAGKITPTSKRDFNIQDWSGKGNSVSLSAQILEWSVGGSHGGYQADGSRGKTGFVHYGRAKNGYTYILKPATIYSTGLKAEAYISESKTWIY